jgi:hypothetical protein
MREGKMFSSIRTRRPRRWPIQWPATIVQDSATWMCTILDVSQFGVKVLAPDAVLRRTRLSLRCDRFGALDGVIVWSNGNMAGVRFSLPPTEIIRILESHMPGLGRREIIASP